ncbi:MAG: cytochrome P450 [Rivularia sp. (in: Bacteria)]|nr:cytochrome P450 [Rivularia sp. MS3]
MITTANSTKRKIEIKEPLNVNSQEFTNNKYEYYKLLREDYPVCQGKVSVMDAYFLSRYDDCVSFLKDPRFVRNRTTATGGGRFPFPMPKSVSLMANSMINEDEPDHRRLRDLVHQAFTKHSLVKMEGRIEQLTNDLLDKAEPQGTVDLKQAYALPIPVTVIQEMVGVSDEDMPRFYNGMKAMTDGFSGLTMFRTLFWDMPRLSKFVRELIDRKRSNPSEDILTALIQAETEGEKLSEDEVVAMVFLLIIAGYETTVYLIINSVLTLLQHPQQLARLRAEPGLINSAVEEILRYRGPVQGTKPGYALEDIVLHGVTIPKGAAVIPLLGAANRDSNVFENAEVFDIARSPNKHLGFGSGIHTCLGAPLARMETRIAITNLLKRNSNLRLAVDVLELELINMPLWHRYKSLPVVFG